MSLSSPSFKRLALAMGLCGGLLASSATLAATVTATAVFDNVQFNVIDLKPSDGQAAGIVDTIEKYEVITHGCSINEFGGWGCEPGSWTSAAWPNNNISISGQWTDARGKTFASVVGGTFTASATSLRMGEAVTAAANVGNYDTDTSMFGVILKPYTELRVSGVAHITGEGGCTSGPCGDGKASVSLSDWQGHSVSFSAGLGRMGGGATSFDRSKSLSFSLVNNSADEQITWLSVSTFATAQVTVVPEPASAALLLAGLAVGAVVRRRRG